MGGLKWKPCYKKSRALASARVPPLVTTETSKKVFSAGMLFFLSTEGNGNRFLKVVLEWVKFYSIDKIIVGHSHIFCTIAPYIVIGVMLSWTVEIHYWSQHRFGLYIFVSSEGQDSIMTTPLGSSPTQGQVTVHLRFHPGPPLLLLHQVGVLHLRGHRHQPLQGVQAAFSLLKVPEGGSNLNDERMNIICVTQSNL